MLQKPTVRVLFVIKELNMQHFHIYSSLLCFGSSYKITNLSLTRPEFTEIQHTFTRDGEYCRHTKDEKKTFYSLYF